MESPAARRLNYYALLRLDTTATAEDVRLAIDRVRRALEQGGWRCWLLRSRGLNLEALAFAETIVSDPLRRQCHDQALFESISLLVPPPFG